MVTVARQSVRPLPMLMTSSGPNRPSSLGTGHALRMALPCLPAEGRVLVLYGDVPRSRSTPCASWLSAPGESLSLLTDTPADPAGYGRVVRQPDGTVRAIVEEKDASPGQKAIREINTGMMVLPASCWLAAGCSR